MVMHLTVRLPLCQTLDMPIRSLLPPQLAPPHPRPGRRLSCSSSPAGMNCSRARRRVARVASKVMPVALAASAYERPSARVSQSILRSSSGSAWQMRGAGEAGCAITGSTE